MKRILLFTLLSLLFGVHVQAYDLSFKRMSVEQGLSQSWVMCITQDSLGFIWLGTSNGLNKYDGYNFTVYTHNPNDKKSILSSHVQDILTDYNGNIWLGTNEGLCLYDYLKDEFIADQAYTKNIVYCLSLFRHFIFAGTSNGMYVYNIENKQVEIELTNLLNTKIGGFRVNAIAIDKNENIWIGCSDGLFKYESLKKQITKVELGQNIYVSALEIDNENRVWVGTENNGLYLILHANVSIGEQQVYQFTYNKNNKNSINLGKILSLCIDNNNQLWVGIENGGLSLLDLNHTDFMAPKFVRSLKDTGNEKRLSSNSVYNIFKDKRGDMWIGTYGGGFDFYNSDGENFINLHHIHNEPHSLINNIVNVIVQRDNELWVGSEGGITEIDLRTNKYQHFLNEPEQVNSISANAVWGLNFVSDDCLFVGLWAGGLNEINLKSKKVTRYSHNEMDPNTIGSDNVFSIGQDHNNRLWIATMNGGLSYMDLNTNKIFRYQLVPEKDYNFKINELRHVFYNSKNELWFSVTKGVGVLNLTTMKTRIFLADVNDSTSFNGSGAFTIFEDSKGTMWFGSDRALNYYNPVDSTFNNYIFSDGISFSSIKSILEDEKGNLWMGTNHGLLVLYNAINIPQKYSYKIYDASDGLQGNEFNRRAAFKNKQGTMYFGGTNGITKFNPANIKENKVLPNICFTDFLIYNKPVAIGQTGSPLKRHINYTRQITLNANQSVFTISYSALNYISTEKTQYAYMLEGFETDWNYIGHKRTATYTNLNPGHYLFKVKAANNDGYWNNTPAILEITILPPWYKTSWALLAYISLLMVSIYLFLRLSQRRFKEREELRLERKLREQENQLNHQRLQFFTNISHEFRTPLTLIISPIEDIVRNKYNLLPDDIKNRMSTIYKNAKRLTRLSNELMDFRKLQFNKLKMNISQQDICAFTNNVADLFRDEAQLHHIKLTVKVPDKPIFVWYDQSMIEKVLFNLISNAFKFTPENNKIDVQVNKQFDPVGLPSGDYVLVSVKDTGAGVEQEKLEKIFERFYQADNHKNTYYSSTGIGLSLAKSLVEMHKGDIKVESKVGKGSVFTVYLLLGNDHFTEEQLRKAPKNIIEPELNPLPHFETIEEPLVNTNHDLSVLIVEDNKELRKYLVKELQNSYSILEAADGKKGLELAEINLPDIIISDVVMPEVDGIELCKTIKENPKISHIPVILLTARATIEDQITGAEAGADAYIIKPFNPNLLKSKIQQLINSRKSMFGRYTAELKVLPEMETYSNFDKDFIRQVADYVIDNISKPDLSVEELGEKMNLSRSQLYRKIKSLSGHSATEFIRIIRLEQSRKLIVQRKLPINEVGYSVGFSTPSYFTKCYKEHFGKLPSEE